MTDLDFKAIGLKIKERRKQLGETQEHIANMLEVNPSLTALVKIANALKCSVDYFISDEYTFNTDQNKEKTLDDTIMDKIKNCDSDKKQRILKMIDIL